LQTGTLVNHRNRHDIPPQPHHETNVFTENRHGTPTQPHHESGSFTKKSEHFEITYKIFAVNGKGAVTEVFK
jgi:hypothetical protein